MALLIIGVAFSCTEASHAAQQDVEATVTPPAEIDRQTLASRIDELAQGEGTLTQEAARELALLRETQQLLEQGTAAVAAAEQFTNEARTAPELLAQIEEFLATPTDQLITPIDTELPLADLNSQLAAARVRLETERDLRSRVDADEQHRNTRRAEIPAERARATERLDALAAEVAAGPSQEEPQAIAAAKRWRALAEQFLQRAVLRSLDEELRAYDTRRPLLEKRRARRDRRIDIETRNIAALQEAISAKQVALAEAAEQEAARQRRAAANSHPVVRSILDESQVITARTTTIVALTGADAGVKSKAESSLQEWTTAFTRSKDRVKRAGLTNAIGQHLRNQRSRLPDTGELRRQMAARDRQISDLVNEAEDTTLRVELLADLDDAADTRLAESLDSLPSAPDEREDVLFAARDALQQQREYLATLNAAINDYLDDTLLELQSTQRELSSLFGEYKDYIDQRILWIRSADVINTSDFATGAEAALSLADNDAWGAIASASWRDVRSHVVLYVVCIPPLVAVFLAQRALRRWLKSIAKKTKRYTTDSFALTVTTLFITLLIAAPAPALMAFIAWRVGAAAGEIPLGEGVSIGLFRAVELLLVTELIRNICRSGGLGEAHFRWKAPVLRSVRGHLRWFVPIVVPLTAIVGVTLPNDNYHDSLGRFAFIAAMLTFMVLLGQLLTPSAGMVRTFLARHRGGWLDRLKFIWYPLVVLTPLSAAVIAGLGYVYSAVQIEQRVLDTAWLLLLVVVAKATLLRGLFIAQRRLDIEQRRKKAAAQAESEAMKTAAPGSPAQGIHPLPEGGADAQAKSVPESEEIDVAAVSAQTRQLLNAAVVFSLLVGLAVVWIDMLPALGFFREVELWTPEPAVAAIDAAVVESAQATGTEVLPSDQGPITLGHLVYSLLIVFITVLVSKNIPGLLEIVLLQRLPISPSGRYAFTTIARYALVIVGVVLAFGAIGIGWSKVQWLAAAITVGLGFGLQEIFANFVSGLIILFERPVRVGDTVTVSGISGTVAKLRIRATTIVDWDRKELIIPNKEFVTGQIINWTLSDPILRVVVPVGIAYGSDTKLAEKLLLQVAKDDAVVLDQPEPTVVFSEFGDSSLVFNLRVFIPNIDDLFPVRHRLHNAIDQAFRKAGIVIAFPQRDVHVYPVPTSPAHDDEEHAT